MIEKEDGVRGVSKIFLSLAPLAQRTRRCCPAEMVAMSAKDARKALRRLPIFAAAAVLPCRHVPPRHIAIARYITVMKTLCSLSHAVAEPPKPSSLQTTNPGVFQTMLLIRVAADAMMRMRAYMRCCSRC